MKYLNLSVLLLVGCFPKPPQPTVPTQSQDVKYGDYTIRVIDSCEYIEFDNGVLDQRVYTLTHKGNCIFCQKRNDRTN